MGKCDRCFKEKYTFKLCTPLKTIGNICLECAKEEGVM